MEKQIINMGSVERIEWKVGDTRYSKEDQMQEAQYRWFWNVIGEPYRRMLFHVDNNSWNAIVGARKKALGVCKGPADFVFVSFGEVVFIENKLPGSTQEPEQIDFMKKVLERGHRYVLCHSFEGFKNFIYTEINKHEY